MNQKVNYCEDREQSARPLSQMLHVNQGAEATLPKVPDVSISLNNFLQPGLWLFEPQR